MTLIEMDETLRALPSQARQEAMDFVEFLTQKYMQNQSQPPVSTAQKILSFAGAWKDMDEAEYQSLMNDITQRRTNKSTRRREGVSNLYLFGFRHYKKSCRVQ